MKTLKFRKELSKLILKKEKTTTWRIFDDYVGKTITAKIATPIPAYNMIRSVGDGLLGKFFLLFSLLI